MPPGHGNRADPRQLDRAGSRESDDAEHGHDRQPGRAAQHPAAPPAAQRTTSDGERVTGVRTGIRVTRGATAQTGDDVVIVHVDAHRRSPSVKISRSRAMPRAWWDFTVPTE